MSAFYEHEQCLDVSACELSAGDSQLSEDIGMPRTHETTCSLTPLTENVLFPCPNAPVPALRPQDIPTFPTAFRPLTYFLVGLKDSAGTEWGCCWSLAGSKIQSLAQGRPRAQTLHSTRAPRGRDRHSQDSFPLSFQTLKLTV